MFLELQKSLLVSFQGYWTQWQRFASSSIHHFWNTSQHFLKTHFCLERWLSFIPRAPQITASNIFRGAEHNGKGLQALAFTISEIPHSIFSKHIFADKVAFFHVPRAPEKSLLVSFQGYWTQWQRFESSSIHHFWDTLEHFLKTHFCLESGFLSFLELQNKIPTSKFSGVLNTMAKVCKL